MSPTGENIRYIIKGIYTHTYMYAILAYPGGVHMVVILILDVLGCMDSVDWNGGMEWWNGMEWNGMERPMKRV